MDTEEIVFSHPHRTVFGRSESNVVAIEIAAGRISGRERPEIFVDLAGILIHLTGGLRTLGAGNRSVILRDGLHRPLQSVARDVFHGGVECNAGRVAVQTNGSDKLNSCLGIRRPRQFDGHP